MRSPSEVLADRGHDEAHLGAAVEFVPNRHLGILQRHLDHESPEARVAVVAVKVEEPLGLDRLWLQELGRGVPQSRVRVGWLGVRVEGEREGRFGRVDASSAASASPPARRETGTHSSAVTTMAAPCQTLSLVV